MLRTLMIAAASVAIIAASQPVFAGQQGTREEAKAMLMKSVAAIKADKTKALEMINRGEGGFLDRDLYAFCFNLRDGVNVAVANPSIKALLGKDIRLNKGTDGDAFGQRIFDAAKEGQINEVSYNWPKPGPDKTPVPKVSFVSAVAGLGCGVGYYK